MQAAARAPILETDDAHAEQKLADALAGNEQRVAKQEIQGAERQ